MQTAITWFQVRRLLLIGCSQKARSKSELAFMRAYLLFIVFIRIEIFCLTFLASQPLFCALSRAAAGEILWRDKATTLIKKFPLSINFLSYTRFAFWWRKLDYYGHGKKDESSFQTAWRSNNAFINNLRQQTTEEGKERNGIRKPEILSAYNEIEAASSLPDSTCNYFPVIFILPFLFYKRKKGRNFISCFWNKIVSVTVRNSKISAIHGIILKFYIDINRNF